MDRRNEPWAPVVLCRQALEDFPGPVDGSLSGHKTNLMLLSLQSKFLM